MKRRDRLTLAKIEQHLIIDDPELDKLLRDSRRSGLYRLRYQLAIGTGLVITGLSLIVGYPTGVAAGCAVACFAAWRVWTAHQPIDAPADARNAERRS